MGENTIPISWRDLKKLKDNSKLVPLQLYKITDYETTTIQEDTRSAAHKFDIIVRADSEYLLREEVKICAKDGDDYYKNSHLDKWKVWYNIDNDSKKYRWIPGNGKGVIFRMIDEFYNDCPYDFTNIQFKLSKEFLKEHSNWCNEVFGYIPVEDIYLYTFNWVDENNNIIDLSQVGHLMYNDLGGVTGFHNNTISPCDDPSSPTIYKLSHNIFVSTKYWQDKYFYGLFNNCLKSNCQYNLFGNECYYNILESNCKRNIFGNHCLSNILEADSHDNTFNSLSYANKLGYGCEFIKLTNSSHNTFGPECSDIVSGMALHSNSFGSFCRHIKCGEPFQNSIKMMRFNSIDHNVRYVNIDTHSKFETGSIQNVKIRQGVGGEKDNYLKIEIPIVNQKYQLEIANTSDDQLIMYCPGDVVSKIYKVEK